MECVLFIFQNDLKNIHQVICSGYFKRRSVLIPSVLKKLVIKYGIPNQIVDGIEYIDILDV